jgi:hypothetical protein
MFFLFFYLISCKHNARISKIELIERRLIDKVKIDHPEENEVTLLTNYKPVM